MNVALFCYWASCAVFFLTISIVETVWALHGDAPKLMIAAAPAFVSALCFGSFAVMTASGEWGLK